ncbi:S8 family serine peptidase [Cellvibrio sp. pealriver]|uniref:S8 family serine peptidase n=1 Tax=Cellvibrio sp. pealriver TaxID=1622269 RepID=UPI00066FE5C6|nr:S8 family serine peptidase [Cellvibrio sp. pealriver]
MKSIYLSVFLLLCLCPVANGQLPDQLPLDQQADSITQELDDVIEEVQESVTQEVDAVVDQLDSVTQEVDSLADSLGGLESGLDDVMGNSLEGIEDIVGGGAEGIVDELGEIDDRVEEQLRNQDLLPGTKVDEVLTKPVADTLALLPDSLDDVVPIVDREGKTVFVEVKVEQDWYAVEREWLLVIDNKSRVDLTVLNARIIERRKFSDLGMRLIRFRVPAELDSLDTLKKRLPAYLHDQLDRNHIYIPQLKKPVQTSAPPLTTSACDAKVKVGMIDTAINTEHPAFAKSRITTKDFVGKNFNAPRAHGTAVAGLLVGRGEQLKPLLPEATLYSASVFHPRSENAQGASMMNLVRALNWLAAKNVRVINMSLAGPDNKILAAVINNLINSGITIVAAAGNEGPAAPPVYPAAYKSVIAVTAVDNQQRSYRWANRGNYVDFAAAGVDVLTARVSGGFGSESGTSMSAPVVSALFACEVARQTKSSRQLTLEQLALNKLAFNQLIGRAIDLGAKGRDPVFGYGLLRIQSN